MHIFCISDFPEDGYEEKAKHVAEVSYTCE
jgi:hypothetical protein